MSGVGAVGSGGCGGAAAAPASSQRVTPSDGGAAVGSLIGTLGSAALQFGFGKVI